MEARDEAPSIWGLPEAEVEGGFAMMVKHRWCFSRMASFIRSIHETMLIKRGLNVEELKVDASSPLWFSAAGVCTEDKNPLWCL